MKSVRFVISPHASETGNMLKRLVGEEVPVSNTIASNIVSYGVRLPLSGVKTLNARAGYDKFEELRILRSNGIVTPRFYKLRDLLSLGNSSWIARKKTHTQGKDIRPILQLEEISWLAAAGWSYAVEYIPFVREYRTWIFQKSHLGTYEKEMVRPHEYKRIGHSNHNGFAFNLVKEENIPRRAVEAAMAAVNALDLNFGAVDILEGPGHQFYVLEVNTAPGVQGERQAIVSLARKIVKWVKNTETN